MAGEGYVEKDEKTEQAMFDTKSVCWFKLIVQNPVAWVGTANAND